MWQMEFPQFCDLLGRMGRVAYNFEDKSWISDAYSSLILKLAGDIPPELELLDRIQLIHAYYGLSRSDLILVVIPVTSDFVVV